MKYHDEAMLLSATKAQEVKNRSKRPGFRRFFGHSFRHNLILPVFNLLISQEFLVA